MFYGCEAQWTKCNCANLMKDLLQIWQYKAKCKMLL
jgi:hypothetical protein